MLRSPTSPRRQRPSPLFKYGDPTVVRSNRVIIRDGNKNCTTCDRVLPFEDFFRAVHNIHGMSNECKDCLPTWQ